MPGGVRRTHLVVPIKRVTPVCPPPLPSWTLFLFRNPLNLLSSSIMGEQTIDAEVYVQLNPFRLLSVLLTTFCALVSSSEEALRKALTSLLHGTRGARVEFYDKFQREADEHDHDFMKQYDGDLDTTLIFVSVLSCIRLDRGVDLLF